MFLSAELVFTIFMLEGEKHKGIFIAPVGICLSLFIESSQASTSREGPST
jgi:aquaporin rerated protein, other eukaryote